MGERRGERWTKYSIVCGLIYMKHTACLICLAITFGDATDMVISCSTKFSLTCKLM